jgi:hypothetical protein
VDALHDTSREIGSYYRPSSGFVVYQTSREPFGSIQKKYICGKDWLRSWRMLDIPVINLATRIQAAPKDTKKTMVFPK